MHEMRDSGIEWVGEIPKHWMIMPVKYFFNISRGRVISVFDLVDGGVYPVYSSQTENNGCFGYLNTYDYSGPAITWTTDGARAGTVFKRDGKYNCTNVCGILQVKGQYARDVDLAFLTFAIGMVAEKNKRYDINGFKIMSNEMANIRFAVPPLEEQRSIAVYLDRKCSEIDALTADIKAQIEILEQDKRSVIAEAVTKGLNPNIEMRDSGIEWVGEIPKHWDVKKGKYFMSLLERPVKEDDDVVTCFRDGEVTLRSNRRESGFTIATVEAGYQGIEPGDLVVHGMDGFSGAIGISDSRGKGTPALNVLDCKGEKRYFMYLLRFMAYSNVFLALATGIRVRTCDTSWEKLRVLYYPLPTGDEQRAIVTFLDNKCLEIDSLIADKKEQLTILSEYKKSLIYEYVTGKKEVPTA